MSIINPTLSIDPSISDVVAEKELLTQSKYFSAMNAKGLNWEGFASSEEELRQRFPDAIIKEWEPTPFTGIWAL